MASTPDELTINYSEGGVDVVKELDKEVLSKGAWTTILFRYQDWDARKDEYSKDKYSIRRYQKRNGEYQQKSKFNISSKQQAKGIVDALQRWIEQLDGNPRWEAWQVRQAIQAVPLPAAHQTLMLLVSRTRIQALRSASETRRVSNESL